MKGEKKMSLQKLLEKIKRLKDIDTKTTTQEYLNNKIKLQGIKETVKAVDKFLKYTFDDFRDNNDVIKERKLWNQIKEELK